MTADELIDSYVTDVAELLPRKQRNDVAFELRALLREELQAKADGAGKPADAGMALALLQAFGRPNEVAARYRPVLTIIDPADGHAFLRATVIGLVVIWFGGLLMQLQRPIASASDLLIAVGHWWGSTVVASMWWPGVLVMGFGLSSWIERGWPQTAVWKPRAADLGTANRSALALAIVGILFGVFVLVDPRWVLDAAWGGHAAPAAYQALTYADAFRLRQAPLLFVLLLLNVPLLIAVIAKGSWSPLLRRLSDGLALITCAAMAWTVLDGPVFDTVRSDQMVKFAMTVLIAVALLDMGLRLQRRVTPAPAART